MREYADSRGELVSIVSKGQVGIIDVDSLNVGHDQLRDICSKLHQQLQLYKMRIIIKSEIFVGTLTSGSLIEVAWVRSTTNSKEFSVQLFSMVIIW